MIFDEISELIAAALETMPSREVAAMFNRDRKSVFTLRDGHSFRCADIQNALYAAVKSFTELSQNRK